MLSSALKLRRATDILQSMLSGVPEIANKVTIRPQLSNEDRHTVDLVAESVPVVPWQWTILMADLIHNAHCSLDHLAYQLALSKAEVDDLPEEDAKRIASPTVMNTSDLPQLRKRLKKYFRDVDWNAIENLQMCNATSAAVWGEPWCEYLPHPSPGLIKVLTDLDNRDKHLLLSPPSFRVDAPFGSPEEIGGVMLEGMTIPDIPLYDGAVVAHFEFVDGPPLDAITTDIIRKYLPVVVRFPDLFQKWSEGMSVGYYTPSTLALLARAIGVVNALHHIFEPAIIRGDPPLDVASSLSMVSVPLAYDSDDPPLDGSGRPLLTVDDVAARLGEPVDPGKWMRFGLEPSIVFQSGQLAFETNDVDAFAARRPLLTSPEAPDG